MVDITPFTTHVCHHMPKCPHTCKFWMGNQSNSFLAAPANKQTMASVQSLQHQLGSMSTCQKAMNDEYYHHLS